MLYTTGMPGMRIFAPKIVCDKCNKHVERFEMSQSFEDSTLVVKAFCHGEEDICKITAEFLVEGGELIEARAFRKKSPEECREFYGKLLGTLARHLSE